MGVFLQQLANALCVGSLYALLAIGYTMVYGVLRLINFAHGEIFMMAMYIVFYGIWGSRLRGALAEARA